MTAYTVTVPVTADSPDEAARTILTGLGMDEHSANDIGGVEVHLVPADRPCLVCVNCGEAFTDITAAQEHGASNFPGPNPRWCGDEGFNIIPESEAF